VLPAQKNHSNEATKLLKSIFATHKGMDVTVLENEELGTTSSTWQTNGVSHTDAAYLIEAQRLNKTLVTDDEKLTKAAKSVGVKTLTSRTLRC